MNNNYYYLILVIILFLVIFDRVFRLNENFKDNSLLDVVDNHFQREYERRRNEELYYYVKKKSKGWPVWLNVLLVILGLLIGGFILYIQFTD